MEITTTEVGMSKVVKVRRHRRIDDRVKQGPRTYVIVGICGHGRYEVRLVMQPGFLGAHQTEEQFGSIATMNLGTWVVANADKRPYPFDGVTA